MKLISLMFVFTLLVITAYSHENETSLLKHITEGEKYNKYVRRPILNDKEPIVVRIEIAIYTIKSLNMKDQILTTAIGLKISWKDEFLTLIGSSFRDNQKITVPLSSIWKPDVVLTNNAGTSKLFEDKDKLVNINSDGVVEWLAFMEFRTYCFVDTEKYPFEEEICNFNFSAQNLDYKEQVLIIRMHDNFLNKFHSNGEWNISKTENIKIYSNNQNWNERTFSGMVFEIKMERRQTYYVWKFLIPTVSITIINIVTLALPLQSDSKVTLATFVVLSFTVMIQVYSEALPSNSDRISLFGVLLWVLLTISGVTLISIVMITALYYRKCKWLKKKETNESKQPSRPSEKYKSGTKTTTSTKDKTQTGKEDKNDAVKRTNTMKEMGNH